MVVSHSHPGLIFAGKKATLRVESMGRLQHFLKILDIVRSDVKRTTLAFYDMYIITTIKSFITQAHDNIINVLCAKAK